MSSSTPANRPTSVLVVDDDAGLRALVAAFLRSHAMEVLEADGGTAMRAILSRRSIDVVVLDVMMPGEDGLSLARAFSEMSDIAILLVSALGSETDRIIGLEVGADDYLAKPISPRELLARIRAVLRRRQGSVARETGRYYRFAGWECDLHQHVLRDAEGVVVTLSRGEFTLLRALLERAQRVLTRDQLLELTRGDDSEAFDRAIDTTISRLRRKLSSRGAPELIRTVRHEGYMFLAPVERR